MSHTINRKASLPAVFFAAIALLVTSANPALATPPGDGAVEGPVKYEGQPVYGGNPGVPCGKLRDLQVTLAQVGTWTVGAVTYTGTAKVQITRAGIYYGSPDGTHGTSYSSTSNPCNDPTKPPGTPVPVNIDVDGVAGATSLSCTQKSGEFARNGSVTTFSVSNLSCMVNNGPAGSVSATWTGRLVHCPPVLHDTTADATFYACTFGGTY